jgi:hypothetical protein
VVFSVARNSPRTVAVRTAVTMVARLISAPAGRSVSVPQITHRRAPGAAGNAPPAESTQALQRPIRLLVSAPTRQLPQLGNCTTSRPAHCGATQSAGI